MEPRTAHPGAENGAPERASRRAFLGGLGAVAVLFASGCDTPLAVVAPGGGVTGGTAGGDGGGGAAPVPTDPLARATWEAHAGRTVTLAGAAGSVRAEVVDVTDVTASLAGDARSFVLAVRADAGGAALDHALSVTTDDGTVHHLDLFPVDRGVHHRWYEAVVCNPA